jgi:hypothetical protein
MSRYVFDPIRAAHFLVARDGESKWLRATQMTLKELQDAYDRARWRERAGLHSVDHLVLADELERRAQWFLTATLSETRQ